MFPRRSPRHPLLLSPNIVTSARIVLIPLILGLFYVPASWALWLRTSIFVLACATDYLDGYLARTYDQISPLGRLLDPLADKLLVVLCLVMLVGFGVITGVFLIPVVCIIARELIISSLRTLNPLGARLMGVKPLAKWKTAFQMTVIGILMMDNACPFSFLQKMAKGGLWGVAALTVFTGYQYGRKLGTMGPAKIRPPSSPY